MVNCLMQLGLTGCESLSEQHRCLQQQSRSCWAWRACLHHHLGPWHPALTPSLVPAGIIVASGGEQILDADNTRNKAGIKGSTCCVHACPSVSSNGLRAFYCEMHSTGCMQASDCWCLVSSGMSLFMTAGPVQARSCFEPASATLSAANDCCAKMVLSGVDLL